MSKQKSSKKKRKQKLYRKKLMEIFIIKAHKKLFTSTDFSDLLNITDNYIKNKGVIVSNINKLT
jgi:hypothetical protein